MQCSTCGTQLPAGAAHCPGCGSVTPYEVSSSGVSPSDATSVFTSYGEPDQYGYPSFDPYATPAQTPPPPPPPQTPPPPRRRLSPGKVVLPIALVLLIVATGLVLYIRTVPLAGHPQIHTSPTTRTQQAIASPSAQTTQARQATASPSAQTPQGLYTQITQGTPALDDSLRANDTNNWTESTSADGQSRCGFSGGGYHASEQAKNSFMLCVAQATNFGNLAYQVQMTIIKGEFGGIVFRADGSQTKYYSFFIDRYGAYTLITSVDNTGTRDYVLHKGTSTFIRTGLNQVNTLAILARGSNIYLYINQQYVTSASDNSYHAGQIGVFGGNYNQAPTDVAFQHVQVWKV